MTFALLRCYHLAGIGLDDGRVQDAVRWIERNWTLDHNPGMPEDQKYQGLYYMYATMGKALPLAGIDTVDVPGKGKLDWRKELSAELLKRQKEDGSWKNEASRWWEGDPILATVYALTALEGCAR
jgi:squalene-hopene/tetraprenyl-beta-curcumene cyclase